MNVVRHTRALAAPALVAAATLLLIGLFIAAAGLDVAHAVSAALRGSVGDTFAIFSGTLKRSTPLLLLGLSVAVSFRAGVLNIGGEGQFLVGAAAGIATALALPASTPAPVMIALEFAAGMLAGAAWGAVAAVLLRRFSVSEVVSTLLLNFVALNLIGFLVRGPMQEPSGAYPQSDKIPEAAQLPILLPGQRLHLGFAIAITLAAVAAWYFRKSASGFRLTITGMSPTVAASAGLVNVGRTRFRALIASGAIAGLAGTCEATGVTYMLFEGLSPGYGYAAIGVALLGELRPGGIVAAAVLFGMLGAGADAMQRDAGVPSELAAVTAAIVILGMLAAPAFARRRARTEPATEAR